jgi:hypothetical protein
MVGATHVDFFPHDADSMLEEQGETSRRYQKARLFRQAASGDWSGVGRRVRESLKRL